MSKTVLLIVVTMTTAVAIGASVCATMGNSLHGRDAAIAAGIGIIAAMGGLLPIQMRTDRTPVALFQSAWIGSILHMALAAGLGIAVICLFRLSTPFVVWLLVMYWITLTVLCVEFARTMRACGSATQIKLG